MRAAIYCRIGVTDAAVVETRVRATFDADVIFFNPSIVTIGPTLHWEVACELGWMG